VEDVENVENVEDVEEEKVDQEKQKCQSICIYYHLIFFRNLLKFKFKK